MHVYSSWPQLDKTRTSMTWKVRSFSSCTNTTASQRSPDARHRPDHTHSDGVGLQSVSVHIVGVGAQKLPRLLALIVQTLETEPTVE